jgi:hypothetical protein
MPAVVRFSAGHITGFARAGASITRAARRVEGRSRSKALDPSRLKRGRER